MFKRTTISRAALLAIGSAVVLTAAPVAVYAQDRVEVTGSRLKRADVEGSLPVTTITRAEIEATGASSIAEFMRTITFASAGNFRPQSGSTAQGFAGIDLRGLGEERTLVLIDGRRAPKSPMISSAADLNAIPMAMIERVEVLTDGASAIYGSDAISGVVNFITRKDATGIELMAGVGRPAAEGGDTREAHATIGMTSDKGRLFAGVSTSKRGMMFTRDQPWGSELGVSSFGNNYYRVNPDGSRGAFIGPVPDGCETNLDFWSTGPGGVCSFDFNSRAADEAEITTNSFFFRGEHQISNDWTASVTGTVARVESFGRYAPTPAQVLVAGDSPNNLSGQSGDVFLRHRFAAAGNRDTNTDNNLYDFGIGLAGRVMDKFDVNIGARTSESKYIELGRNYIVRPLAEQYINSGEYDIVRPYDNDAAVLNAIKATISRDSLFKQKEVYGDIAFDLFSMTGGTARMLVGAEYRTEDYSDQFDSLQEAGVIEGSAGNSAGGGRNVKSVFGEVLLPITSTLEGSVSARFEDYSDYGSDFSPKVSLRWKAMPNLSLRASAGTGFRAPELIILTAKDRFSAESVIDEQTCLAFGGPPATCGTTTTVQVDSYFISNPELDSEKSKQFSFGAVWDVTPAISVKADYWNIKITDQIKEIDSQDIINRANGQGLPIPAGLGLTRDADGAIVRVNAGYANEGELKSDGLDVNAAIRYALGSFGQMRHDITYSRLFSYEEGGFEYAGSFSQPKDRMSISTSWSMAAFTFSWNIGVIGGHEFRPDDPSDERSVGTYTTHDLQARWATPIKGGELVVGMRNAFDKRPALVPDDNARPFSFDLYDAYGRTPYIRYTQAF